MIALFHTSFILFLLPLTQFDAAILTTNNGLNIATIRDNAKNSAVNRSLGKLISVHIG
jgi:hypothetical protein